MAESDWGRTNAAGIARAEIRTAPVDLDAPARTVRDDLTTYGELSNPAAPSVHGWSPPTPPPPDEASLRLRLAEMLEVQQELDERLADAQAANQRAQHYLQTCTQTLRTFDGLDDRIAADITAQLSGDNIRVEVDAALNEQVTERERSRVTFAAATRAAETLARDLVEARGKAAEAATSVDRLIAGVLAFTAEAIAAEHEGLVAAAETVRERLLSWDHWIAGKHVPLSMKVRSVLGNNVADFVKRRDIAPWREAAAQLRADPNAVVSVA